MPPIRCFLLEPTERMRRSLRRYASSKNGEVCPAGPYHNAFVRLDEIIAADQEVASGDVFSHDHALWPRHCLCGYRFKEDDVWQLLHERLYRRSDTGMELIKRNAEPGAMWYEDHLLSYDPGYDPGPDGRFLHVRTPGGDWNIDSRCSNCPLPADRKHKCWVRHGIAPDVHVDKNGLTCQAGAGSIVCGSYHGFLHHGFLTPC